MKQILELAAKKGNGFDEETLVGAINDALAEGWVLEEVKDPDFIQGSREGRPKNGSTYHHFLAYLPGVDVTVSDLIMAAFNASINLMEVVPSYLGGETVLFDTYRDYNSGALGFPLVEVKLMGQDLVDESRRDEAVDFFGRVQVLPEAYIHFVPEGILDHGMFSRRYSNLTGNYIDSIDLSADKIQELGIKF